MKKNINIKEVAKKCNVSIAAVSYTLNNVNKVSAKKKELILKTIEEMGYKPNLNAVALIKNESKLIGILLPLVEKDDRVENLLRSNPFYMEFISGAESAAQQLGYDLILSGTTSNDDFEGWLKSRSVDGIIAFDSISKENIQLLKDRSYPTCLIDSVDLDGFVSVRIDDKEGEYLATKYLISLGHKNIAFACSSIKKSSVNKARYKGFKRAMEEANLPFDEKYIFEGNVDYESGVKIAENIIKHYPEVTGVIATSDILALGIMKGCNNLNKKIPEDLSIIGFDDIQISSFVSPRLTTIKQDIYKKGIVAVENLVKNIKKGQIDNCILMPELTIRESAAKIGE